MLTRELFARKRVFSMEVFPPKPTTPVDSIYRTLEELSPLKPDFISVTYGAGGSGTTCETFRIAEKIRSYGIESVAHLTGQYLTHTDAEAILGELERVGVGNILALRGDAKPDRTPTGEFPHASDLVRFVRERGDFHVLAACYPEKHPEAPTRSADLRHLKEKVDTGADHLISQLFLDNGDFYRFREACEILDIDVPIEAGIMPVVNRRQIERMATLCGARIPPKFATMMARYEHNADAMRDAGIAYAVDQIVDLLAQGVAGIHLYTMNNPYIARRIHEAVRSLIEA